MKIDKENFNFYQPLIEHFEGKFPTWLAPEQVRVIPISEKTLDEVLGTGYGIFSGNKVQWAKLKFNAERARWVAQEQWHPKQKSKMEADGSYLLEIPYSDDRELVMDILRHGAAVDVLAPPKLRERIIEQVQQMQEHYV